MKNRFVDHHMHTNYSPDADIKATFNAYLDKAIEQDIKGLMFTDHVDIDTPEVLFHDLIDYNSYQKALAEVRKRSNIPLYMGVEIGYQPHLKAELNRFVNQHPFDFVIASIHVGDYKSFYEGDFFKGKTDKEAYLRYFEICLEMVENYQDYDVFGHLDYIIRYGASKQYLYEDYKDLIDNILTAIIKNNKGLEINTSGIRYNLSTMHPSLTLLKRYKALGGTIITLGSDAHQVKDLQSNFDQAITILKAAGFNQITEFKRRIPTFIDLP
ncbi:MAG: histidinol-phosphatase HisJ family protein [Candidatus Izemoplasmataceae bacterium]